MSTDDAFEGKLRAAIGQERMPAGLKAATLERIRAERAIVEASVAPRATGVGAPAVDDVGRGDVPPMPTPPAKPPLRAVAHVDDGSAPATKARRRRPAGARARMRRISALIATCLVACALAAAGIAVASETAQVALEGSSSIELGLNRWNLVVRASSTDPALDSALDELGLTGLTCSEALVRIGQDADIEEYLASEPAIDVVAVSDSSSQQDELVSSCASATDAYPCATRCHGTESQTRDEAHACGMGMARYLVYEEIAALDPSITVEECQDMSMRELRDLLTQVQESAGVSSGESGTGEDATGLSDGDMADCDESCGQGMGQGQGQGGGHGRGGQGKGQGMGNGRHMGSS